MLEDGFKRKIEYLRLSVTDVCNIRCQYCMPLEGVARMERSRILRFEEIYRLVRAFVGLGVHAVRITGGEPLVRKELPKLLRSLNQINGLKNLVMTTNGILLKNLAGELKEAGLNRINIHLDTLDPVKFKDITRWGSLKDVLAGIQASQEVGLKPIKLNTVLQKGINDNEIVTLAQFAAERDLILRFIEIMPIGPGLDLSNRFLPTQFVLDELSRRYTLVPFGKHLGSGPAEYFKIVELDSVVGLIHPVSQPFCDRCNRIRISADGRFQDCLAYEESTSLRELLRDPRIDDDALSEAICRMISFKRADHGGFLRPECPATKGMYGIGG